MAAVTEKRTAISWEEYSSLPLTHYEIIDGGVHEWPSPSIKHQRVSGNLFPQLSKRVEDRGYGIVLNAALDALISRTPLRTRQPDLLFISKERGGIEAKLIN